MNADENHIWAKVITVAVLMIDLLVFAGMMGVQRATGSFIGGGQFVADQILLLVIGVVLVVFIIAERKR